MNSRWLWNVCWMRLWAPDARASKGSQGVPQNILILECGISRVLQVTGISHQTMCSAMLASLVRTPCRFVRLHTRLVTTGIYSVEMSQAFHRVDKVQTWILLKYAFSATQNWEKDSSQIYLMVLFIFLALMQGPQICQIWCILHQNCSDDSTEVTEGVTSTPEIFGNKHSFVLTFVATNTIYVNCKRCKL